MGGEDYAQGQKVTCDGADSTAHRVQWLVPLQRVRVPGPINHKPTNQANNDPGHTDANVSKRRLRESALLLIGSGLGCDAQVEGEPDDWTFRNKLWAHADRMGARARRSLRLWSR